MGKPLPNGGDAEGAEGGLGALLSSQEGQRTSTTPREDHPLICVD